jgi:hypothetical protein
VLHAHVYCNEDCPLDPYYVSREKLRRIFRLPQAFDERKLPHADFTCICTSPSTPAPLHPAVKMLSGILIFNQKGENLIFRAFRNDCRPRLADVFRIQVISNAQVRSPILTLGSTTFSHVKHENIYLVAITKSNANAALVFEFLYRLVALGKGYFGKFDEEAVKNNFVLVYELLDGRPGPL